MVERRIAQINMIVPISALVFLPFARVARICHRARIRHFHYDASILTTTVATIIWINAANFQMLPAHLSWTTGTLTLAHVSIKAIVAVPSFAVGV